MSLTEIEMYKTLVDLKKNHNVKGLKLSFEDEGTLSEEAQVFMRIAARADLPVSIKIGGCEAKKDMYDAAVLGAAKIVGPMVETPYALQKFVQATHSTLTEDQRKSINFYINCETITGCNNIEAMLATPEAKELSGIVLGRVDLIGSLGLTRDDINSDQVFQIANRVATAAKANKMDLLMGGAVSTASMPFFKKLPQNSLKAFETRNVIFDAEKALEDKNIELGLAKAMYFELKWLEHKKENYGRLSSRDDKRIDMMTRRYNDTMNKINASAGNFIGLAANSGR